MEKSREIIDERMDELIGLVKHLGDYFIFEKNSINNKARISEVSPNGTICEKVITYETLFPSNEQIIKDLWKSYPPF